MTAPAVFRDRKEAGIKLAQALAGLKLPQPVVLALPRGGVPVAAEIAAALHAPLEVLIVRKVGAPGNPELAVAALVAGHPDDVVLNREMVEAYGLSSSDLGRMVSQERPELERRNALYNAGRRQVSLINKTAILVDDGIATGTTVKVALRALRRRGPAKVVLAVPVAPAEVINELMAEADMVICPSQPQHFRALSTHYLNFAQLTDSEVIETLRISDESYRASLKSGRAAPDPIRPHPGSNA